jgi:GDP-4-dehydro-6-deoxy-D-mannose reductase
LKVLITGVAGFVGNHLIEYLTRIDENDTLDIAGVDINLDNFQYKDIRYRNASIKTLEIDLRDRKAVEGLVNDFKPDAIYHLAAQSSVSYSWENPIETFEINVSGGINLLESVTKYCPDCRILVACTAEEYGEQENGNDLPIAEDFKIHPTNPYAISKSALDFFSTIYQKINDLNIYVSRSFNHTGPGQSDRFVTSDFSRQIAEIEKGLQKPEIFVGNTKVYRDFLDVRDVISAYKCILDRGRPGEVYNVCSGVKTKISDILEILLSYSSVKKIKVLIDENRLRPIDMKSIYGNNEKLRLDTGWKQNYNIKASLLDVLNWWRKKKGVV